MKRKAESGLANEREAKMYKTALDKSKKYDRQLRWDIAYMGLIIIRYFLSGETLGEYQ